MKLASHNSWSYATPKKWWMKLIKFTAKCQNVDIKTQYEKYGVRAFDLRLNFENNDDIVVVHGPIKYNITKVELLNDLNFLNNKGDVAIRIILDIRNKKKVTDHKIKLFKSYCVACKCTFRNIKFFCGECIATKKVLCDFDYKPYCKELYASVCSPNIIDDWYPKYYAKHNNNKNIKTDIDCDYLMIDFVDIK